MSGRRRVQPRSSTLAQVNKSPQVFATEGQRCTEGPGKSAKHSACSAHALHNHALQNVVIHLPSLPIGKRGQPCRFVYNDLLNHTYFYIQGRSVYLCRCPLKQSAPCPKQDGNTIMFCELKMVSSWSLYLIKPCIHMYAAFIVHHLLI
jgi:hypothetical protein